MWGACGDPSAWVRLLLLMCPANGPGRRVQSKASQKSRAAIRIWSYAAPNNRVNSTLTFPPSPLRPFLGQLQIIFLTFCCVGRSTRRYGSIRPSSQDDRMNVLNDTHVPHCLGSASHSRDLQESFPAWRSEGSKGNKGSFRCIYYENFEARPTFCHHKYITN